MKANVITVLAGAALMLGTTVAAHASDLFTSGLPANSEQTQECRIVNVSGSPQVVTTEAFNSNGVTTGGPFTQTLAAGEAGGFALAGFNASMYCKFTVSGPTKGFRASIDVSETTADGNFRLVVALPAS
jgi:hypothetical protein